jgi:hypothetical protein
MPGVHHAVQPTPTRITLRAWSLRSRHGSRHGQGRLTADVMPKKNMESNEIKITTLEGEELNIVSFVMDYVEFHFNGPVLRALTNPRIETAKGKFIFPREGSRDALCSLIGKTVKSIDVNDGVSAELVFETGEKLSIPLDLESQIRPEAMHWCPINDGPIQIW